MPAASTVPSSTNEDPSPISTAAAAVAGAKVLVDDDAFSQHRSLRVRRVKLAIVTSLLMRPLSVMVSFITVPLFLKYLGTERYGLYETIGAMAMWLSLTDGGLGAGLQIRLQDCLVHGKEKLAQAYVSSLVIALGVVALLTIGLFSVAVPLINWSGIFPTHDILARQEIPWAVWAAGTLTLLGSVSNITPQIYSAYQEQHRWGLWDGAARLLTLAACVAVVRWPGPGLVGVLVAAYGVTCVLRLVNSVVLLGFEKPALRPRLSLFDIRLVRATLGDGIYMFILQFAVVAIFQSDRIIIGWRLSAEQVTPYAIAGRLFLIAYGLFMIVLAPLWPAYGEAIRRGDVGFVRRGVRLTIAVGCGSVITCGVILFFFGDRVFPLWTRSQQVHISKSLILAMTATFVLRAWVDSRTVALNSVGILRPQLIMFVGHAVLNLALALMLARPFGVEGVAWATPISAMLTSVWGYPWLMKKLIYSKQTQPT
jgi:O-antigen/teichoic acid export membrane protein